jgi:hypothetical protein
MNPILRLGPFLIGLGCSTPEGTKVDTGGGGASSIDVIGILITPDEVIVPVGTDVRLEATGLAEDRTAVDLTDAADWYSGAPSVAQVSNALESEGLLSGIEGGVTTVVAVFDGIESAPAKVTVTDAELDSLTISPPSVILGVGEQIQLTSEARFSDGVSADASSQVRWITGDASVVTLDGNGQLNGAGTGTTTVHVEWAGVTSDAIEVEVVGGGSTGTVDLTIADVYATVDEDSGVVSVWVDVENLGSGTAAAFWIDVWIDPASTPGFGDWPDAYGECEYVGPGDLSTVLIQLYTTVTGGSHDLFLVVDSTDDIAETSESNNTMWAETSGGGGGSGKPNLVIDYFGGYSDEDEGVSYYWVDVTNEATSDAGGFYVDIYHAAYSEPEIDSTGDVYQRVNDLGAGQTEFLEFIIEDMCSYCESWTLLDSFDEVDESNEGDNTAETDVETL